VNETSQKEARWVTDLVRAEPRAPLMAPYMAYLILMFLSDRFPSSLYHLVVLLHIAGAFWVVWLFRHHYPPLGKTHLGLGLLVGLLATCVWVGGQHLLDGVQVGGFNLGGALWGGGEVQDPRDEFGAGLAFWGHAVVKIARAVTIVPIVEELFWRGFILRAFVSWDRFDEVPLGKFTWFAFLGSSLLSTLQHPSNWAVSIACWMIYNGLFYWKKSLRCLMVTHAVTNLALYTYVLLRSDWRFW
jgi:CAAX prenyl protease-like protein